MLPCVGVKDGEGARGGGGLGLMAAPAGRGCRGEGHTKEEPLGRGGLAPLEHKHGRHTREHWSVLEHRIGLI